MPGPCAYVGKNSAKYECIQFRRIFKRKKHTKNAKKVQKYIQNQLKEDLEYDQMTLKEYVDPFTGEPVKQNKQKEPKGLSREMMLRLANHSMGLQIQCRQQALIGLEQTNG